MIIAIDFDGTCVKHQYPLIGEDIGAVPVLKKLVEKGHQLILWTMRSNGNNFQNPDGTVDNTGLEDAVNWFIQNGISLYGVQRNPTQDRWTSSLKCYAQMYIDDAALGCPLIYPEGERPYVDWKEVERMLTEQGIL